MRYVLSALVLGGSIFLSSCGGSGAEGYAEDLCDCMDESGYMDEVGGGIFGMGRSSGKRDAEEKMEDCALPILKEMHGEFKEMDDDEKKEFVKDFMKASIDTECSDQLMDNIPWALVMNGFKSMLDNDRDMNFFGGVDEEEERKIEKYRDYEDE